MDTRQLTVGFFSLVLLAGAGAWALARPDGQPPAPAGSSQKAGEEPDEEVVDLAKAPDPVRAAAVQLTGGEKAIKKVIKEEEEDVYTYEVEYTADGVDCSAVFSATGDLMELEKGTTEAKIPAAALAALKEDYPKATFANPSIVTRTLYEIEVVIGGKKHDVKVDAAGNIEDGKGDADKDRKDAESEINEKGERQESKKSDKAEDDDNE